MPDSRSIDPLDSTVTTDRLRRVLITGGAGFIGSHLTERLLASGAAVTVIDDLSTGRRANLARALESPRFRLIEGDAGDERLLREHTPAAGFVFHLAAPVGLHRVLARPDRVIADGVAAMDRVLDAAAGASADVLVTSSSEVYGKKARVPFREDDDLEPGPPTVGRWGYALMKAAIESMALARHRRGDLRATVARMFNVVGPRQTGRYGMVLPRFIRRARANEPLVVHGDGRQTRTFLHVADAVDALVSLAVHRDTSGEVYNIGGREEISIRTLAERVIAASHSTSPIRFLPYADAYPEGYEDVPRRSPDLAKIVAAIGWSPRRSAPFDVADLAAFDDANEQTPASRP